MDNQKLHELERILQEGTPYGDVIAISTDGETNVNVLTETMNLAAHSFICEKVGELFSMDMSKQGGVNFPIGFKKNFLESVGGGYLVEK